jgi:hypothetical protein
MTGRTGRKLVHLDPARGPSTPMDHPNRIRRRALLCTLAGIVTFTACSSTDPDQTADDTPAATTSTPADTTAPADTIAPTAVGVDEVVDDLNAAGSDGFACTIGDIVVAWDGTDSLFRSMDTTGTGLEIVTVDMVSYARYVGSLDADASAARRAIVERLAGGWASWGQPDTITLEELPATPLQCLSWIGIEVSAITGAERGADGAVSFRATSDQYTDGVIATLAVDTTGTMPVTVLEVRPAGPGATVMRIHLGATAGGDVVDPARDAATDAPTTISQEEYFSLVGG